MSSKGARARGMAQGSFPLRLLFLAAIASLIVQSSGHADFHVSIWILNGFLKIRTIHYSPLQNKTICFQALKITRVWSLLFFNKKKNYACQERFLDPFYNSFSKNFEWEEMFPFWIKEEHSSRGDVSCGCPMIFPGGDDGALRGWQNLIAINFRPLDTWYDGELMPIWNLIKRSI